MKALLLLLALGASAHGYDDDEEPAPIAQPRPINFRIAGTPPLCELTYQVRPDGYEPKHALRIEKPLNPRKCLLAIDTTIERLEVQLESLRNVRELMRAAKVIPEGTKNGEKD